MNRVAYSGTSDHPKMLALARMFVGNNPHIADWPYRFASWAFDQPDNIALWINDTGELIAWAVMQTPFWTIDYAMHPDAEDKNLHRQILAWADERAQLSLNTSAGRPIWFVNVFREQTARINDLEGMGFANQADVGEESWSKVLMARNAATPLDKAAVPSGFKIRLLNGTYEIEAYVTLHRDVFESENMTVEWRRRTLRHPAYKPELDLVLEAPDGSLAGFCVCWLDGDRGQIEPMGIRSDLRGQRLGKALLMESLRRLQICGATHMFVETDNYRNAAFALYQSVGFQVHKDILVFRKDFA